MRFLFSAIFGRAFDHQAAPFAQVMTAKKNHRMTQYQRQFFHTSSLAPQSKVTMKAIQHQLPDRRLQSLPPVIRKLTRPCLAGVRLSKLTDAIESCLQGVVVAA